MPRCSLNLLDTIIKDKNNFPGTIYVDRIFPVDLEIKDTTYTTNRSASHLHLHFEIDNEGQLRTKLYNKR